MKENNYRRAAVALIINGEGRVLLTRRSPARDRFPNFWELPGGELELGESPESGVVRELSEEIGVKVRVASHLRRVVVFEPVLNERWVTEVLGCSIVEGTPKNCEPSLCIGVDFFDLDSLPEPLLPEAQHDIEFYRESISRLKNL